ncbi:hypothetical protein CEXT_806071 [Caerostris extrusa]|uniref:Uncharacterized protein n=1 Tax=Caerostris extrusa TaxID=172846 RepID=A0AAV4TQF5_CAEEX|nr:hypothetical protein CEXT_806071 [Caerostris extrusa]
MPKSYQLGKRVVSQSYLWLRILAKKEKEVVMIEILMWREIAILIFSRWFLVYEEEIFDFRKKPPPSLNNFRYQHPSKSFFGWILRMSTTTIGKGPRMSWRINENGKEEKKLLEGC